MMRKEDWVSSNRKEKRESNRDDGTHSSNERLLDDRLRLVRILDLRLLLRWLRSLPLRLRMIHAKNKGAIVSNDNDVDAREKEKKGEPTEEACLPSYLKSGRG